MWRRVAFSMGLSLILFGIVAVVTTGELADAQEMPIKAESSPRTNAVAFQQEVDSYPAATDVPTATNVITFRQDIDGYVGCADTRISAEHPNTNFGDEELVLGMRGQVGTLIRFDVSSIPPFAVIEEAKLGLFCHNYGQRPSDPAEAAICAAYPVSRTWKEMEATWNKAMELDSWGLPGCDDNASDRSPTPLDQQEIYTHTQWYTWNVTSAVQDWVKDHASNKGVYIRQLNTEVGGEYDFRASEYRGLEKRPYLTIKYLLIPPPPDITVSKELTQPPSGIAVLSDTLTFTLRITNIGLTAINSLTVTDTYDGNFLTPTSWSQEPDEQAPGIITWTWNTLDPFLPLAPQQGFAWTLDFLGKAPTDLTTNTITARGVDEYGQTVAQEDHADVQIIPPRPDITVSKELTQPPSGVAVLSETITFTLRITNTGLTAINSLTVTDTYDSNLLTLTSWSQEPDEQTPGVITWTWNTLDPFLPLAPQQGFAWTLDFLGKAPTDLTTNTITARGVDEYGQAVAPKKDHADVQIISDYYRLYLPKVLKKFPMICVKWGYTFREEFEDPALDGWMVSLNGGQVEVSNGIIHLGTVTNTNTFPLVCRCQLLDDTGEDFAMEARFRHSDFTAYGTTVALNSASYDGSRVPAGQPLPPGIEDILNIHHVVDETEPENDRFDISMLNGRVLWNGTPGDTNWHVVRVTLEQGGWYTLYVDGQCIGSARSSVMPSSIYIGNPTIQSFRERWTQLHVDYIRISRCVEWDP